jgi:hypothetical protein
MLTLYNASDPLRLPTTTRYQQENILAEEPPWLYYMDMIKYESCGYQLKKILKDYI